MSALLTVMMMVSGALCIYQLVIKRFFKKFMCTY